MWMSVRPLNLAWCHAVVHMRHAQTHPVRFCADAEVDTQVRTTGAQMSTNAPSAMGLLRVRPTTLNVRTPRAAFHVHAQQDMSRLLDMHWWMVQFLAVLLVGQKVLDVLMWTNVQ